MTKMGSPNWNQYHVLITGSTKIPADGEDKIQEKEISELKLLNFTAYNELMLAQEDTAFFQITEEAKTESNNYGASRLAWKKLSRKFEPTTGASKTRLRKKILIAN